MLLKLSLILALLLQCLSALPSDSFQPPTYKQSDPRWGNDTLGFGPDTISSAGCLITSVTSALAGYGIQIDGVIPTPHDFNNWLKLNGGYLNSDWYTWESILPLGFSFQGFVNTTAGIAEQIMKKNVVILNVSNGHHYVLCIGINAYGYAVMDPATPGKTIYNFTEVVRGGVYAYKGTTQNKFLEV